MTFPAFAGHKDNLASHQKYALEETPRRSRRLFPSRYLKNSKARPMEEWLCLYPFYCFNSTGTQGHIKRYFSHIIAAV